MEAASGSTEFNPYKYEGSPNVHVSEGYLVVLCGLFTFLAINFAAVKIGPPKNVSGDIWRWRNTFVSWVHADIVGTGVLYCLLFKPEIASDFILYCDNFIYFLVAFSMGYFVYDVCDHAMNNKLVSNYEVILHHLVVLWSFWYDIQYRVNVPYTIIALMTEIHSIFLHARKLMQFDKWPFDHWLYKMVVSLNFITFVRFRLWGIFLISWGIYTEWGRLTFIYQIFIVVTMFVMYLINPILFWRLLKNDVLRHFRSTEKKDKLHMNGACSKMVNGECHLT
ncbi:TLC domain-containing protein 2-like [Mercenaria mercenaria]|uniref:TLC domain-containing protein 2-like n=1 Tax=Mercenaria mercenaria TaxID=6596 RepID=UPI00234F0195|nr:TLC domain-containing protein 2-like [Mercenaria mercenaria]